MVGEEAGTVSGRLMGRSVRPVSMILDQIDVRFGSVCLNYDESFGNVSKYFGGHVFRRWVSLGLSLYILDFASQVCWRGRRVCNVVLRCAAHER